MATSKKKSIADVKNYLRGQMKDGHWYWCRDAYSWYAFRKQEVRRLPDYLRIFERIARHLESSSQDLKEIGLRRNGVIPVERMRADKLFLSLYKTPCWPQSRMDGLIGTLVLLEEAHHRINCRGLPLRRMNDIPHKAVARWNAGELGGRFVSSFLRRPDVCLSIIEQELSLIHWQWVRDMEEEIGSGTMFIVDERPFTGTLDTSQERAHGNRAWGNVFGRIARRLFRLTTC